VSTPTAAPPAWLEAAAKLDALLGDKVPVSAAKAKPADDEDHEIPEADAEADDREGKAPSEQEASATGLSKAPLLTLPARKEALPARQEPRPPAGAKPRSRITPPIVPAASADATDETELAWLGYAPVALVPSVVVLAAASTAIILALRPLVPVHVLHEAVDVPIAAAWLLQLFWVAYRLTGYNYRLTTRRLFRERGRLYPPELPLELATVVTVAAEQSRLGRWLGVGTVRVVAEDGPPWALTGVRRPGLLADMVTDAAKAARESTVSTARVPA
jgi:hypothetical protein